MGALKKSDEVEWNISNLQKSVEQAKIDFKHPDPQVRKFIKKRYLIDMVDTFASQELEQI